MCALNFSKKLEFGREEDLQRAAGNDFWRQKVNSLDLRRLGKLWGARPGALWIRQRGECSWTSHSKEHGPERSVDK